MREALGYACVVVAAASMIVFMFAAMKLMFLPLRQTADKPPAKQLLFMFLPFLSTSKEAGRYFVMQFWAGLGAGAFFFSAAYLLGWPLTIDGLEILGGQ